MTIFVMNNAAYLSNNSTALDCARCGSLSVRSEGN